MTTDYDRERELRAYLEERGVSRAPDGLLQTALARVDRTRQRPGWLALGQSAPPLVQGRMPTPGYRVMLVVVVVTIALLAAAMLVVVGSRPRLPKPFGPAGNGLIAFDANGTIVIANADGSGRRPLITGPGIATVPSWSPDGTRIAFFVQPAINTPGALYVAEADGSHAIDVSAGLVGSVPQISQPAAWSPDGSEVAFTALTVGAASGDPHIVVTEADGSGVERVGPHAMEAQDPIWSPDGKQIAFRGNANAVEAIYVMDATGANARRITTTTINPRSFGDPAGFRNPQWSPDGTRILFFVSVDNGNHDIFVAGSDGSGEHNLTNSLEDEMWPTWSPDGRLIAFGRGNNIVVAKADGTDPRVLVSDASAISGSLSRPTWSPDGSKIVVYVVGDLMEVLDVAGGSPVRIPAPVGATGDGSWQRIATP